MTSIYVGKWAVLTLVVPCLLYLAVFALLIFLLIRGIRQKKAVRTVLFSVLCAIFIVPPVWITFWNDNTRQRQKDFAFIEEEMKPAILFVRKFYGENARLPTEEDFYHAGLKCKGRIEVIKEGKKFKDKNYKRFADEIEIPKGEYIIWIWRGEWAELYYSHNLMIYSNAGEIYFP